MLTYPVGVEEVYGGTSIGPVLPGAWKNFTYDGNAQSMLAAMNAALAAQLGPNNALVLDNASSAETMFVYQFAGAPQIYEANGQDSQGNIISELLGYIIDRQTKPAEFVDENIGPNDTYPSGAKLQMNLEVEYGYAQFYWSDPNPPANVTLKKRMPLAVQRAMRSMSDADRTKLRVQYTTHP